VRGINPQGEVFAAHNFIDNLKLQFRLFDLGDRGIVHLIAVNRFVGFLERKITLGGDYLILAGMSPNVRRETRCEPSLPGRGFSQWIHNER
jgi:hypothetical protein